MKNIFNKEFHHFVESQLTEVRMMKMQMIQFLSNLNLIQMKLMKVIHRMKNMMNKEFQHFVESQLIEVRNMMKMQMIQFVSILNLIQMKLMKLIYNMKMIMKSEFQFFEEFQSLMKLKNYELISVNNINHNFMFEMEAIICRFNQDRLNFAFANAESPVNCTLCRITIN
jgi:hypothetical protein